MHFKVATAGYAALLVIAGSLVSQVQAGDNRPDPDPLCYTDMVQIYQGTDDGKPEMISRKIAAIATDEEFVYTVVVIGEPDIKVKVEQLPKGLTYIPNGPAFDFRQDDNKPRQVAVTGRITGKFTGESDHVFVVSASNARGSITRKVTIRPQQLTAPTPPMGWLSWNFWGQEVTQDKMKQAIDGLHKAGLYKHGWKYVVIDDSWQQGKRTREAGQPIKPNPEKFPNMKELSDYARKHNYVLGIYTSPWSVSYAQYEGSGHYETLDVKQFKNWNIGYLKLDYRPWEVKQLSIWSDALRTHGKGIVYAFSNNGIVDNGGDYLSEITDVYRTGADIYQYWESICTSCYTNYLKREGWKYVHKGHWPDLDMLEIGFDKKGRELAHNEQHFQMTMWSILPAALLITCDTEKLTDFHLSLLTNDEVIGVNQDPLGLPAKPVYVGNLDILYKPLADKTFAVGFFNPNKEEKELHLPFEALGFNTPQPVRDLWAHKDMGNQKELKIKLAPHTAMLFKVGKPVNSGYKR